MSYFKALVSKKKRRFQEEGFDLDLTYIKPNIVAMGFPSDNLEGVYRNHIEEVIRFLEARHKDHYKVYNLCSERHYDPAKFKERVARYPFDDHNAPPFELIKPFCEDLHTFLKEDEKNVAFIHCKAGKGRTGVMICSYLLHNGHFSETKEALKYYGDARTKNAKGVTIPSQRRYVQYYGHLLRNKLDYIPKVVLVKAIEMSPAPTVQDPYFMIWQQKVKTYQSKVNEGKRVADRGYRIDLAQPIPICGDIKVEFFYRERFKKERMFQFWFNTFFISQAAASDTIEEDEPTLKTFELDSDSRSFDVDRENLDKAHKDEKGKVFTTHFKVTVIFSEVGLETSKSASLSRIPPRGKGTKHRKSPSLGSCDEIGNQSDRNVTDDEDNFSDSDTDEKWIDEDNYRQTTRV